MAAAAYEFKSADTFAKGLTGRLPRGSRRPIGQLHVGRA